MFGWAERCNFTFFHACNDDGSFSVRSTCTATLLMSHIRKHTEKSSGCGLEPVKEDSSMLGGERGVQIGRGEWWDCGFDGEGEVPSRKARA